MIKDLGNYSEGCSIEETDESCKSQESALALIWTVGVFALNVGPVIMGFVLDYLGPKFTALLGILLNMIGLILFGVSSTANGGGGVDAFIPAAIILGLGNITFHLAQFHISALFPQQRGLISSVFVAGFTGCGIVMYFIWLIFESAGATETAYKTVLICYSGICALWIPLMAWMMPNDSFRTGMVYLMKPNWKFETRVRAELDTTFTRTTALQDYVAQQQNARTAAAAAAALAAGHHDSEEAGLNLRRRSFNSQQIEMVVGEYGNNAGLLNGGMPDSSDPFWAQFETTADSGAAATAEESHQRAAIDAHSNPFGAKNDGNNNNNIQRPNSGNSNDSTDAINNSNNSAMHTGPGGSDIGPESMPLPSDISWGPLIFESRRFVELRKKTFKEQFFSAESCGMGIFYTLNIFILQFYLGTMRIQLLDKGDIDNAYTNYGNVVVAFAFLTIPIVGWLLDKKGYAITLGTINGMNVAMSVLQALPVLWLQWFTITTWMIARFFMYSSYFAIFGGLFGFKNFGKLVAIDNTFNGLFGLLQYPVSYAGIHALDGDFTWISVAQIGVLLPLFFFCYKMYKWERQDLVPIRPLEGEELPVDVVGPRKRKELNLHLPNMNMNLHLPNMPRFGGGSPRGERIP
jgi:MFS family permease